MNRITNEQREAIVRKAIAERDALLGANVQAAQEPAQPKEPSRPDILERLTYHALERDDMTLDDCLSFLAEGWKRVHGRTERQMVMQILAMLATAPAQAAQEPTERALFEAWLRSVWTPGYACPRRADGCYEHHSTQRFWECWQAARAQSGERTPMAQAPDSAEPVGHLHSNGDFCQDRKVEASTWPMPLYTRPAVTLTAKEIGDIELSLRKYVDNDRYDLSLTDFARAILARAGESRKPLTRDAIHAEWTRIKAEDDSWSEFPHVALVRWAEAQHGITDAGKESA